jgi:hypothetical protein
MAIGLLILKSFWANEAIFQLKILACNLPLLFKFNFLGIYEFRQQITCACGTGAGKNLQFEGCFSGRENFKNGKNCGDDAAGNIPV